MTQQQDTDRYGNKLNTYTVLSACTPVGRAAPVCPAGWISVGYTKPGSCTIGNAPGDGPADAWQMYGYNRVCKRRIPTSGDLAVDCCSNLFGINDSVECKARGFKSYSGECNKIMADKCNTNVGRDPFGPEWNGMPNGQSMTVYDGCSGKVRRAPAVQRPGCVDEFCTNYLRNAPPNNYFHDHDFSDFSHDFPRYSYATPNFSEGTTYQPMRTPYKPYTDPQSKNTNNYCKQFPGECWNTRPQNYHL